MTIEDEPRDYHGRWTTGGGGGGDAAPLSGRMPSIQVRDPARHEDARRVALAGAAVAAKLGFDPSKMNVTDAGRTFMLNGKEHSEAGHFDHATGTVTLQTQNLAPSFIPELVTHEVTHAKFQAFLDEHRREYDAVMKDPATGSEWRKNAQGETYHYVGMKADGTLNDELAKKYPLYQAYAEFQRDNSAEKMQKEDGCTPYSKDWWDAFFSGTATQQQAYHETLAEMAAIKQRTGFSPDAGPPTAKWNKDINNGQGGYLLSADPSRSWNKLYDMVDANWKKKRAS